MMMTLVIPYYESPNMLREHIKYWKQYPKSVTERLWVVLVDDGSPRKPAEDVLDGLDLPVSVRLYRIEENIPWNVGGARNLGFTKAADGWVFSIDIDHVVPAESMQTLLSLPLNPKYHYLPTRYRMVDFENSREYHRPPASFIVTKKLFWKVGGFDEDFSGHRGGVTSCFRRALKAKSRCVELSDVRTLFFPAEVIPDAMVTEWGRDVSNDPKLRKKLKISPNKYNPKDCLRFNWDRVL